MGEACVPVKPKVFRDTIFIKRNLGLTDLSVYIVVSLLMYHLLV